MRVARTRETLNFTERRAGKRGVRGGAVMTSGGMPRRRVAEASKVRTVWIWTVGRATSDGRGRANEGMKESTGI